MAEVGEGADQEIGNLEVHVFGGGIGECIVLGLPGGRWGVVDFYLSSLDNPEASPVIQYLRSKKEDGLFSGRLEFFCLTHPHEDHFRGAEKLLGAFPPKHVWISAAKTTEDLWGLVSRAMAGDALAVSKVTDEGRSAKNAKIFHQRYLDTFKSYKAVLKFIEQLEKSGTTTVTALSDKRLVYPSPMPTAGEYPLFRVYSLGPCRKLVKQYEAKLHGCFGSKGEFLPDRPQLPHNDISPALLIVFGKTRVLLGGDVEEQGWREIVGELQDPDDEHEFRSQLVKVSHHGSPNGSPDEMWQAVGDRSRTASVITGFRRHALPEPETIEKIRQSSLSVSVTSTEALTLGKGEDSLPTNMDVNAALQLKRYFSVWEEKPKEVAGGQCSYIFDDQGTMLVQDFAGAAAEI